MTLPTLGDLDWRPAIDHPELLAVTTHAALVAWMVTEPAVRDVVGVAAIDPALADTAALVAAHRLPLGASVNCVLVAGTRDGVTRVAAAAVPADTRADVNHVIKRLLDVRKASFMHHEEAVAGSTMEYGGITPIGLPTDWRVLVDGRVPAIPAIIIGSGIRASKLILPGELLARLPGAEVVEALATSMPVS